MRWGKEWDWSVHGQPAPLPCSPAVLGPASGPRAKKQEHAGKKPGEILVQELQVNAGESTAPQLRHGS